MAISIVSQKTGYNFLDNAGVFVLTSDLMGGSAPPYTPTVENLQAFVRFWVLEGANYVEKAILKSPYSSLDKQTKVVVQELFDFDLASGKPATPSTAFGMTNAFIRQFRIRARDYYGSPPELDPSGAFVDSTDEKVIHGGTRANDPAYDLSSKSYLFSHNYAMSGAPRKKVHKTQPDWVYVFTKIDQPLEVRVKVYLDTGATYTHEIAVGVGALDLTADKHQMVASGWDMYNMSTVLTNNMISGIPYAYDMVFNIGGDEVIVPYQLDLRPREWGSFILHYNCMGGFETLWLSGKHTRNFEPTGDEVQHYHSHRTHTNKDYSTVNRFTRARNSVNTGWQHAYAMEHLEQLFLGPCFLIEDSQFLPVTFEKKSVRTTQDDTGRHFNTELVLLPEWRNRYYNQL